MVALMAFGDSSINFEMDVFISDFSSEDDLDYIRDDINSKIFARFKQEGIEIPYPHRVVHNAKN